MSSLLRGYASLTAQQKATVGDVKMSAVGVDHMGWLICDGRFLNVADWRALHNAIGYQFGGSGATFRLPNPAGRVLGAIGSGSGLTPRTLGDSVGTETHTLTIAEMPAHKHGSVDVTGNTDGNGLTTINGAHNHGGSTGETGSAPESETTAAGLYTGPVVAGSGVHSHTISTDGNHIHTMGSTGGGAEHNNMQPTLFIGNTFIYSGKPTNGVYPLTYNPPALSTYGGMPQIL